MINRRQFMLSGTPLLLAGGRPLAAMLNYSNAAPVARLRIDPETAVGAIPANMMGLSYESTQLGEPDVFSPDNHDLIALFRTLSPHGSLRLGGNSSEFTYFKATEGVRSPAWSPAPTQPEALTPITPFALRNLRGFLDATGWNCIYGLNLGTGTPERAAEEAEAVTRILGSRLEYLQIGNEPNNYIRYKLRSAAWGPEAFMEQWLEFARAVVRRVPQAKLGGPDCYSAREWMQAFSMRAKAEMGEHLAALTDHYYAEGPPSSPDANMANLLHGTRVNESISVMSEFGGLTGLPRVVQAISHIDPFVLKASLSAVRYLLSVDCRQADADATAVEIGVLRRYDRPQPSMEAYEQLRPSWTQTTAATEVIQ